MKRYTHSISLTENQESKLESVREKTGFSIVKILMATVDALNTSESDILLPEEESD